MPKCIAGRFFYRGNSFGRQRWLLIVITGIKAMLLLLLLPVLIIIQLIGYHLSRKRQDTRYRWWTFLASMALYYGALTISYRQAVAWYDASAQERCGMWMLAYFMCGVLGLALPFVQLLITLARRWKKFREA